MAGDLLPDSLPPEPWPLFQRWWNEAHAKRAQPNPNCFTLATIDPGNRPSARIVLCKDMNLAADRGYIVFHTHYHGRKGRALDSNPRAAAVFHWDALDKQVRIEGIAVKSPPDESDAYFATRSWERRIGAWASEQSEPIASRAALLEKVAEVMRRFRVDPAQPEAAAIPRPPHWGGYRLWADAVEVWLGGHARIHDRARWSRTLSPTITGFTTTNWLSTRLQP